MKITLNIEVAAMLIESRKLSDKNFNSLIKESMELLLQKYSNQSIKTKEHNVQQNRKDRPELT